MLRQSLDYEQSNGLINAQGAHQTFSDYAAHTLSQLRDAANPLTAADYVQRCQDLSSQFAQYPSMAETRRFLIEDARVYVDWCMQYRDAIFAPLPPQPQPPATQPSQAQTADTAKSGPLVAAAAASPATASGAGAAAAAAAPPIRQRRNAIGQRPLFGARSAPAATNAAAAPTQAASPQATPLQAAAAQAMPQAAPYAAVHAAVQAAQQPPMHPAAPHAALHTGSHAAPQAPQTAPPPSVAEASPSPATAPLTDLSLQETGAEEEPPVRRVATFSDFLQFARLWRGASGGSRRPAQPAAPADADAAAGGQAPGTAPVGDAPADEKPAAAGGPLILSGFEQRSEEWLRQREVGWPAVAVAVVFLCLLLCAVPTTGYIIVPSAGTRMPAAALRGDGSGDAHAPLVLHITIS